MVCAGECADVCKYVVTRHIHCSTGMNFKITLMNIIDGGAVTVGQSIACLYSGVEDILINTLSYKCSSNILSCTYIDILSYTYDSSILHTTQK